MTTANSSNVSDLIKNMSLSKKAILIGVTIRRFSGTKKDNKATVELVKDNNVKGNNARVWKSLLKGDCMSKVVNAEQKIRQFLYKASAPWNDSFRITRINNYKQTKLEIEKLIKEFNEAVKEVVAEYDNLVLQDKIQLGDLFNAGDYPSKASFAASFGAEINVEPVRENDFRSDVLDNEDIEEINNLIGNRMTEYAKQVEMDLLMRVNDKLTHLLERLANGDGRFHESNITNVFDVIKEVRALNITENPKLDSLFDKVEESIGTLSSETIRDSKTIRGRAIAETTQCVGQIAELMKEFDV